ncbi:group I truncated hemoglobin [Larsenimonas rhizosphaerae]|uniref:Group 1 truncated hemoglobin n=1 Tax=Larsenimonas rhizosphaerae TaxID=2944682 RepID=A0AA42CT79_9GAMM|nr:group 1 truncated hemoglobin [Larsenimonas rhizosphaerae]MCM2130202.1 group 1 truncated hemoglobin [Larsenimonas rhizosphaerae]MCX2522889.1 group 1 truncated hemoglobin [Larsenimonas rhizosphaerae]
MLRTTPLLMVLILALITGCASTSHEPPAPGLAITPAADDTLYRALGQREGIQSLIRSFLYVIADDPRIVDQFAEAPIDRLEEKLNEMVCVIAGGPCHYSGDSMRRVHRGKHISNADFNALVEDLIKAMDREGIPFTVQNTLLARLAVFHGDIVHR